VPETPDIQRNLTFLRRLPREPERRGVSFFKNADIPMLKNRIKILFLLLFALALGLGTKFYTGPAAQWVHYSLGGLFYELFWCLFLFFFFPRSRPVTIALLVFLATSFLEFLQLSQIYPLPAVRNTLCGQLLIGTTFAWSDFLYYFAGCLIGWFWMERLKN